MIEAMREEKETNEEENKAAIPASSPSAPPTAPATYHGSVTPKQHADIIMVSPLPPALAENKEKSVVIFNANYGMSKGKFLSFFENSGTYSALQVWNIFVVLVN